MAKDVIITPASGLVDFYETGGNIAAYIQLDNSNNLVISANGDINLGDTTSDVYIGDGINNVDIVFEQNGNIRALTGKTLTLGQSDSNLSFAAPTTATADLYVDNGTSNYIKLYTEENTSPIGDTFAANTGKSYIYFQQVTSSNDPGYIMHETSGTETNEGVLHLSPSDDNAYGDYVSIHGTNDADKLKLHTDGTIEGVSNLTLSGILTGATVNAATIGNSGATLTGTLSTAAQTNITSVGTLTGLTLSGTLTGTTINAATIGNSGAAITGSTLTGTIQTASQTNITGLGTITTGTWSATTIATSYGGTGLTSFTSGGALYATSTSALTTGTLPVASGGTGTTTSTGSGSVVLSASPTFTGTLTAATINAATIGNAGASIVGNLTGAATTATTAQYVTGLTSGNVTTALGYTPANKAGDTFTGDVVANANILLNNRQSIQFYDTDSSNWAGFRAPNALTADVLWSLPTADGTAGQILSTDGAKNLYWQAAGGGSSGFINSTVTTVPGTDGNYDLAKPTDQTQPVETPFEAGGSDAFGVSLGIIYDDMEPIGRYVTLDYGDGEAYVGA